MVRVFALPHSENCILTDLGSKQRLGLFACLSIWHSVHASFSFRGRDFGIEFTLCFITRSRLSLCGIRNPISRLPALHKQLRRIDNEAN